MELGSKDRGNLTLWSESDGVKTVERIKKGLEQVFQDTIKG